MKKLYIKIKTLNNKTQTGFGCIASVEAYNKNIIKKHEFTTPIKEDDRVLNIKELQAQTGPVLLAYKQNVLIKKILDANKKGDPVYSVIGPDSSIHNIWVMEDKVEIDKIVYEINSLGELYIADGHHRSAAASRICEEINLKENNNNKNNHNFFLSVAFPHSEMTILDYNRIITGLNDYKPEELINEINKNFVVKKVINECKPHQKNEFGMFLDNAWYQLNLKENLKKNNISLILGGVFNSGILINPSPESYFDYTKLDSNWFKNLEESLVRKPKSHESADYWLNKANKIK